MKRSRLPLIVLLTAVLGMLAGAGLRVYQLTRCMTETGLIVPGSRILYGMLGFAVVGVILTAILCGRLNRVLGTERCFCAAQGYLFADLAAAVVVFYGSLQRLLDGGNLYIFAGGMAAAVLLAAAALCYGKQSRATFWLLLLPCVFLAVQLINDFKRWSTDPLVIDFCFRLLAQLCGMLAVFHLSGFPLNVGRKRLTVFWSVGTVVFTAMLLPDYFLAHSITLGELMPPLGIALWCAAHALRLLRPAVQNEQPPEEPAQTPVLHDVPTPEDIPTSEDIPTLED